MKRAGVVSIVLAAILLQVHLVACSTDDGVTSEIEVGSPTREDTGTPVETGTSVEQAGTTAVSEDRVVHEMAIGETVNIHGILVTVTSAEDGPDSVDGMSTCVIHVTYAAVPDSSYDSEGGTHFSPQDWALEYTDGGRTSEVATVNAEALGDVTLRTGGNAGGDIYLVKRGEVARIVYTPSMFDWYPEVTTWDLR